MFGGFKTTKIKPQLKMAVHRLQISSNKKVAQIKNQKRDIAKLLIEKPTPKEEKARIRAEALIREDSTVEAFEILQLNCELLSERIKLIAMEKTCPSDLVTVVSTLIWASARVDIAELIQVRKQLRSKYGKEFEEAALNNTGGVVNERVFVKLSVQPPPALLVQTYLEKIAEEFDVDWKPKIPLLPEEMPLPAKAPTGHSVPVAPASGYGDSVVVPPPPSDKTSLPGAYAIPSAPPIGKAGLPSADIGLAIPPPFATNDEETSEEEEEESFVPESTQNEVSSKGDFQIPSAPTSVPPDNINEVDKEDDNNNDDDDSDRGYNLKSDSFRDLEARFAELKK